MSSSPRMEAQRRIGCSSLSLVLVAGLAFAAGAAPRALLVEPRQQAVGEVEPDQVQHYKYTLRNAGDAPLSIQALEPTCYCTIAKADAWEVPPGGSTTLYITIDPSDFVGDIVKGVDLTTNDPKDPKQRLEISMRVRPGIAVVPPELDFGTVGAQGSKPLTVDLKTSRDRPFHVEQAAAEVPYVSVQQEPIDMEYRIGTKLVVKVLPGAPPGPFATRLVVLTDDPGKPRIEIPLRGAGPGGLVVQPEKLVFKPSAPGTSVGTLEVSGGKVAGVRTDSSSLLAALEAPRPGENYRVTLRLAANAKPGRLLAKVFLSTGEAKVPDVTVPVTGVVR